MYLTYTCANGTSDCCIKYYRTVQIFDGGKY